MHLGQKIHPISIREILVRENHMNLVPSQQRPGLGKRRSCLYLVPIARKALAQEGKNRAVIVYDQKLEMVILRLGHLKSFPSPLSWYRQSSETYRVFTSKSKSNATRS
jgi:hypothetical protein